MSTTLRKTYLTQLSLPHELGPEDRQLLFPDAAFEELIKDKSAELQEAARAERLKLQLLREIPKVDAAVHDIVERARQEAGRSSAAGDAGSGPGPFMVSGYGCCPGCAWYAVALGAGPGGGHHAQAGRLVWRGRVLVDRQ